MRKSRLCLTNDLNHMCIYLQRLGLGAGSNTCFLVIVYKHDGRGSYQWLWRSLTWWPPPLCPSGSWFLWRSSQTQTHPRGRSTRSAWLCLQPQRSACCSLVHSPDPGENRRWHRDTELNHSFVCWGYSSTIFTVKKDPIINLALKVIQYITFLASTRTIRKIPIKTLQEDYKTRSVLSLLGIKRRGKKLIRLG